jgi:hypothetical protein
MVVFTAFLLVLLALRPPKPAVLPKAEFLLKAKLKAASSFFKFLGITELLRAWKKLRAVLFWLEEIRLEV